jgi:hypothetical protein
MASEKESVAHTDIIVDAITNNHEVSDSPENLGTTIDQHDMYRMGKIQRLRV